MQIERRQLGFCIVPAIVSKRVAETWWFPFAPRVSSWHLRSRSFFYKCTRVTCQHGTSVTRKDTVVPRLFHREFLSCSFASRCELRFSIPLFANFTRSYKTETKNFVRVNNLRFLNARTNSTDCKPQPTYVSKMHVFLCCLFRPLNLLPRFPPALRCFSVPPPMCGSVRWQFIMIKSSQLRPLHEKSCP